MHKTTKSQYTKSGLLQPCFWCMIWGIWRQNDLEGWEDTQTDTNTWVCEEGFLPEYEGHKTNHLWCEIWTRLQLWSKGCCWHDTDCKHQIFLFQRNPNVAPIKFAQWANVDKCLFNLSGKFSLVTCSLCFPPSLTLLYGICLHLQWPHSS